MPKIAGDAAEREGVVAAAKSMAIAARTAPKARGLDAIETLILYGDELETLAEAMVKHGKRSVVADMFKRDADSVRKSHAVLLVGLKDLNPKKMEFPFDCGACGFVKCSHFLKHEKNEGIDFPGPTCLFQAMDLGIAISSACSVAARFHIDNRLMYSIGGAARTLRWMESQIIIGIPLSSTGKNIFFDR